jgi:orotate phosphoribosyltransferase
VPSNTNETLEVFKSTGAYLKGHFRLTSGLHSPEYLQCALVLQHPDLAARFGRELAEGLGEYGSVDVVVSPAVGGLIIGHEVARTMGCRFLFAEREGGLMTLRRGFTVEPGLNAVVVEDVITTGGSTREVIDLLRRLGVNVLAVGSVVDRSGGKVDLGIPRISLAVLQVITYPPDQCPLCLQGSPVVKPGSRPGA